MAMLQKLSACRESSITSNASGSKSQGILNMNCERKTDLSGIALKARKPYTISKQRQKWTEEEHQKFIEALQLYGRAWRQIEEYIGTKTAVQIRSHAQKFFSKVMKEGASSTEASAEPIEIPPPRPKRKPLHPYPRKLMETPNKIKQCPSLIENGTSTSLKTSEREAHSPISVLSPEGSQISTSHAKEQGSGCVSRTSSGSNLSHVVEKSSLIKDSSTLRKENEKEGNLSLTLNITGPSLDDSTLTIAGKVLKDIEFTKDEDNYSETRINFAGGGGAPLKIIKLFGHTVAVANQSEYSDGMNSVAMHLASKESQTDAPITEMALNLVNQLVPGGILMGERPREKEGSKGFSRTGLSAQTNLDSVDSKIGYSQRTKVNPNDLSKGFAPYKRCLIDREAAASLKSTADDRESQRIRVYL